MGLATGTQDAPKEPPELIGLDQRARLGRRSHGSHRIAAFLLAFFGASNADAAPPPWTGVWAGTIGAEGVQVCLQHEERGDLGAYFYLRHLGIISLRWVDSKARPEAASTWTEAPERDSSKAAQGPFWKLSAMDADHLRGVWTGSGKTLPIVLTRVPVEAVEKDADKNDAEQACGSLAFSKPRLTTPKISRQPASLNGAGFTKLFADVGKQFDVKIESFQLIGSTPEIERVNATLRKPIPTSAIGSDYLECSRNSLSSTGADGHFSSATEPKLITRNWLVSKEESAVGCGGAHPGYELSRRTWDLRKGREVNLWDWFKAPAVIQSVPDEGEPSAYREVELSGPFRKMLDAAYPRHDDQCKEEERQSGSWNASLTRDGIAFTPEFSHASFACTDDSDIISFTKLEPFLSAAGKQAIADVQKDLSAH